VNSTFSLRFRPLLFRNCKCFLHRYLTFRQRENPDVSPLLVRAESQTVYPFFMAAGLQLHFARLARRRTRGPTSLQKVIAAVAFRESGNKCGTVAVNIDSLIARRLAVFPARRGLFATSKIAGSKGARLYGRERDSNPIELLTL
jgi:hypothetical protein